MIQIDELRLSLIGLTDDIKDLSNAIGIDRLKAEISDLEEQSAQPDFWSDIANTQVVLQRAKLLKDKVAAYESLYRQWEDAITLAEIALEEKDESVYEELKSNYTDIFSTLENMRLSTLLTGEYDKCNAIITLHAGAGGTEAMDWALMLYRMYVRWGERHKYKVKLLDMLDGEEAGIKSAVIHIEGLNAFGFLKSEMGVHRLVRVSPFDASGRRHTSFASVEVMPEIDDASKDIEIRDEDLKVDTYRSSGAGGQHVNKTESAIRITHIPSGIIVACQNERSQHQNREMAMKMLKSKLFEIKEREHYDKVEDIRGDQKEIGWGSQIRSYVFMPYTLVKDARTSYETGNVSAVMDGDIDGFINAYLKMKAAE